MERINYINLEGKIVFGKLFLTCEFVVGNGEQGKSCEITCPFWPMLSLSCAEWMSLYQSNFVMSYQGQGG